MTTITIQTIPGNFDLSQSTVTARGGSTARTMAAHFGDVANVLDFGAVGDGVADDAPAIQAAIDYIAPRGGLVFLPMPANFYKVNSQIVLTETSAGSNYSPLIVEGEGFGTLIKPGAAMTSLFRAIGRLSTIKNLGLVNASSYATHGILLDYTTGLSNDVTIIDGNYIGGFTNGIYNVDGDAMQVKGCYFAVQTGWDIRSIANATNAVIDGCYALGSSGGLYFSGLGVEGVRILNSTWLPTGGMGIRFDAALACVIDNCIIDQCDNKALFLDGTSGTIGSFMVSNSWFGSKSGGSSITVGVDVQGNAIGVRFVNCEIAGWSSYGMRLLSATNSVQSIILLGCRFVTNGTGAGSCDLLVDSTTNPVNAVVAKGNYFQSTGGSVKSVIETGSNCISLFEGNRFASTLTKSAKSLYMLNFGDDVSASSGFSGFGVPGFFGFTNGNAARLGATPDGSAFAALVTPALGTANYVYMLSNAAGNAPVYAVEGSDTNIDISFVPKGSGVMRFGAFTSNADAAVNGYVTIKDAAGNARKLATIA